MPKCKVCGTRLAEGAVKCLACGAAPGSTTAGTVSSGTNLQESVCPACNAQILNEHRYCPSCGADLKEAAARATAPAPNSMYGVPQPVPVVYNYEEDEEEDDDDDELSSDELIAYGSHLLADNPKPSKQREAFQMFQAALNMGNEEAHLYLGSCYLDGIGTGKNPRQAFSHFEEAHYADLCEGTKMLGLCYYLGIGVEADKDEGKQYLEDAKNCGSVDAKKWLKRIRRDENRIRKEEEREWEEDELATAIGAGAFLSGALLAALFS